MTFKFEICCGRYIIFIKIEANQLFKECETFNAKLRLKVYPDKLRFNYHTFIDISGFIEQEVARSLQKIIHRISKSPDSTGLFL